MKNFRQLIEELPSKKIVLAFGYYQPATVSHNIIVAAVNKISHDQNADNCIYISSNENPKQPSLSIDRRMHFAKRIFSQANIEQTDTSLVDLVKLLNNKYNTLTLITSNDKVEEYKKNLNKSNGIDFSYKSVEVLPVIERDPDIDQRVKESVKTGNFDNFRKLISKNLTDFDTKRLMNELRHGMNLNPIIEQVKFETSSLREKYHSGSIFKIGDKVTDNSEIYEIVDRGPNYISVVNENGNISKKWLDSVQPIELNEDTDSDYSPEEIVFKGYKTQNLHNSTAAVKAFQQTIARYNKGEIKDPVAILNALKYTDTYLAQKKSPASKEVESWNIAHAKARDSLNRIDEFTNHSDYWQEIQNTKNKFNAKTQIPENIDPRELKGRLLEMKYSSTDKIKIARVIASALGVEEVEKISNPDQLINNALRKVRNKPMRPEYVSILHKMIQTADEAGIKYDQNLIPQKISENQDIPMPDKDNESDIDAVIKPIAAPESEVGHSMTSPKESPAARRMKIKYVHEETDELDEDQVTAEYTIKKYVGSDGKTHQRKIRPHRVNFKNSRANSEPEADDVGEFKEETETEDIKNLDSLSDSDLDNLADKIDSEDDVIDAYEDEELALIDDETGEHIDELKEETLNEVLSRMERIKAKARFARTSTKRERRIKIALKSRSSSSVLNKRARTLAIKLLKSRLAKKPLNKLSVGEKERLERVIAKRKTLINRLAMKLVPKVRKIENNRLTHKAYTK